MELFNGTNLPALSVELHSYIDRITVQPDRQVTLRMTALGAFPAAAGRLARISAEQIGGANTADSHCEPHEHLPQVSTVEVQAERSSINPRRFEGIDANWFQTEQFEAGRFQNPCRMIAPRVKALRDADRRHWTIHRLSEHLHVGLSTIDAAMRISKGLSPMRPKGHTTREMSCSKRRPILPVSFASPAICG